MESSADQRLSLNKSEEGEPEATPQLLQVPQEPMTRKRSSGRSEDSRPARPIRRQFMRLIELKEQLLAIRQRKAVIPKVPDPQIVSFFTQMKQEKQRQVTRKRLQGRIEEKKKELKKLRELFAKCELQFSEKGEIFREKSALLRVLGSKMQVELGKTKQRYREVQFNKVIVQGLRKVLYYRLTEILLNQAARPLFGALINIRASDQKTDQDAMGTCLGYLALFMSLVGTISGARMWIGFTFKGHKSTIKAGDGSILLLHPREGRLPQARKLLEEQLSQLLHDTMKLDLSSGQSNFYQLCEELTKQILSAK